MLSNKVDSQPAPPSMSHSRRYWRESLESPADSARSGVWTKGLANVPESFVSCGLQSVVPTKKKKRLLNGNSCVLHVKWMGSFMEEG